MKFIVDRLPYSYDYCPFEDCSLGCWNHTDCPRKYDSKDWQYLHPNTNECVLLKELESEQK